MLTTDYQYLTIFQCRGKYIFINKNIYQRTTDRLNTRLLDFTLDAEGKPEEHIYRQRVTLVALPIHNTDMLEYKRGYRFTAD